MNFKLIDSVKDPYYQQALTLYDSKLGIKLQEDAHIFKRSLENNKTENDYSFIVGLNEHQQVVSMATAHYEATTNSAFLIYLLAQDGPEHDNILDETLTHIEAQINSLSNKVHNRNVNFIMLEVPQTTPKEFDAQKDILHSRRQFLYEHQFEKQTDIRYLHPNNTPGNSASDVDLFIKPYIKLSKDVFPASVKSNYILKYVFANGISRDIIYPLLVKMNLLRPF